MSVSQIRDGIVGIDGIKPYNILILFLSLAYMSVTLDITGVLQAAAFWVSNKGSSHGYKLFFYFYLLLTALSVCLGNDPVILSGTTFLVYFTKVTELNPISWLISEFAAANTASMVVFVGNPTNVVICEGFLVNNAAFTAYTILPFLGCSTISFVALAIQFRKPSHIPRHLAVTKNLDVMSVLTDPVGASIGGALLGMCLMIIIIASFFSIDVWKISLPFAAVKFLCDIIWDHHRWGKNVLMLEQPKHERLNDATDIASGSRSETTGTVDTSKIAQKSVIIEAAGTTDSNTKAWPATKSPAQVEAALTDEVCAPSSKMTISYFRSRYEKSHIKLTARFPTFFTALPRLPFALIPFAFCQFILIEALEHQGWVEVFSVWLVNATSRKLHAVIWLVGVLGVISCNLTGTNIGATILLTKVVRAAALDAPVNRAAAIALAVASNIGAVSFTYSASLAGLLWKRILEQKGIHIKQKTFACWHELSPGLFYSLDTLEESVLCFSPPGEGAKGGHLRRDDMDKSRSGEGDTETAKNTNDENIVYIAYEFHEEKSINGFNSSVSKLASTSFSERESSIFDTFDPNLDAGSVLEDDSPYPEVRSAVANYDDPDMPASTLRAWILGLFWSIIIPGMNQFFYLRYPSVAIGGASLPTLIISFF
ncbi:hypothetical protein C0992_003781 [Termitomyces sp. T32_za158]|nr:hypothetical protein C0992_003781 [Termitomyces sp. T32_za158]